MSQILYGRAVRTRLPTIHLLHVCQTQQKDMRLNAGVTILVALSRGVFKKEGYLALRQARLLFGAEFSETMKLPTMKTVGILFLSRLDEIRCAHSASKFVQSQRCIFA